MNQGKKYQDVIDEAMNMFELLPTGVQVTRSSMKKLVYDNTSVSDEIWFSEVQSGHQRGPHAVEFAFTLAKKAGLITRVEHGLWVRVNSGQLPV